MKVHAFLALLAGFVTMLFLSVTCTMLLGRITPGASDGVSGSSARSMLINVVCSFVAAAAGGYVTVWAAGVNPLYYVMALGIIVLAVSALSALQSRGKQPIGYQLALVAIAPLGVLAGGLLRLRMLGMI